MDLESQLVKDAELLGVLLPKGSEVRLLQYLSLIEKWNRTYNLTAVKMLDLMLSRHLLDSLSVLPYTNRVARVADVGSGAGLPGIPLALALPDSRVVLFECNQKKTAFLRQVCIELGLQNVDVIEKRVEAYHPKEKFDLVISRAFTNLTRYLSLSGHLCKDDDKSSRIVAMKGANLKKELTQIPDQFVLDKLVSILIPGLSGKRHFVFIKHKQ